MGISVHEHTRFCAFSSVSNNHCLNGLKYVTEHTSSHSISPLTDETTNFDDTNTHTHTDTQQLWQEQSQPRLTSTDTLSVHTVETSLQSDTSSLPSPSPNDCAQKRVRSEWVCLVSFGPLTANMSSPITVSMHYGSWQLSMVSSALFGGEYGQQCSVSLDAHDRSDPWTDTAKEQTLTFEGKGREREKELSLAYRNGDYPSLHPCTVCIYVYSIHYFRFDFFVCKS